jgi:hypothetical protein
LAPQQFTAVMPSGPGTQGPRTVPPLGPPPQGPRTRPPVPLPEEPEPPRKSNRGLAIAASILAVLLVAGVAYAIINAGDGNNSAAGPTSSTTSVQTVGPAQTGTQASKPVPTTEKKPVPTTQTYQSQPPSKPATKFTQAQVTQFVKQHYAKLPKDVAGALADWDPESAPSESSEKEYWSAFNKVAIKGNPLVTSSDDGTFQVTTALELTAAETGDVTTGEHTLKISGKGDKLLIIDEQR